MIYLHKILPILISPIALILLILIIGVYKMRRSLIISAILLLYVFSMPIISKELLRTIEAHTVRLQPADIEQADAIVVLSGMLTWSPAKNGLAREWGDPDRFWGGIELFQAEKAPLLIFTGGKLPWELGQGNEGDVLKKYAQQLQVPEEKIVVTFDVQNTEQEARAVREILKNKLKIILVTSAFHMNRAQSVFEREEFKVVPYPVDFKVPEQSITLMSFLPHAGGIGQTDLALRELIGIAFYKFKGWLSREKAKDIIQ